MQIYYIDIMGKSKKQGIKLDSNVVNEETINQFRVSMTPNAIPDIDSMLVHIDNLLNFVELPEMKKLETVNKKEFERLVYGRFNAILPINIINLLLEDDRYEHLDMLLNMCDTLKQVKDGKMDIHQEHAKFSEKLSEKYVYPKFGGKENFENEMMKKPKNNESDKQT
jgi:hypothetical protein